MHVFNLEREQEWNQKHHVEKILGRVADGDVTVACWEPGQISPSHCHPDATEIYFCVSGGGTMRTPPLGERVIAEDPHAPKHGQRTSLHHFPWGYRICVVLVLTLFGLHLLAAGSGAGSGERLSVQRTASDHTGIVSRNGTPLGWPGCRSCLR